MVYRLPTTKHKVVNGLECAMGMFEAGGVGARGIIREERAGGRYLADVLVRSGIPRPIVERQLA